MRYQAKPYRSLSFLQREAQQLRDVHNKENKENNNVANIPLSKVSKPLPTESLIPKHKLHQDINPLASLMPQSFPEQLKKTYSELIGKEYSKEILSHLCASSKGQKDMLDSHSVTASLRSKMVDWMIEVLSSYKMTEETFFRSVFLMDGFMKNSGNKLEVKDLHLIGVSSMFSAAKYEEINPLKLSVIFEKIARKKFKKNDILDKESEIVKALDFRLEVPSVYDIARHVVEQMKLPLSPSSKKYFKKIILYLSKMSLFNIELAQEDPSILACGVVFIALKTLEQVDPSAQPESRLGDISRLMEMQEQIVLEVSRKVLDLAKNYSKNYPSLNNLKKFNKFEYGME